MDPLANLDLRWDTSLCLLRELNARGHETFLFIPEALGLHKGKVFGRGNQINSAGHHHYRLGPERKRDLAEFHAVLVRKDPPFDSSYLGLTYLLEPLARETSVINHPQGIRNANEKLFGLVLERYSPPTLVSARGGEIAAFQKKLGKDLVIKPLYQKGGEGVFKFARRENPKKLDLATGRGKEWVIAQEFIPVPKGGGDKRILLWKGKILGAFERIPAPGDFRTNLSLGGKFVKCGVSETEGKIVRGLAPLLIKEGLFFTGIDVRGGKLIEINVTSPAGLVELDLLYGGATKKIVEYLEGV